ncbi:unnamed protein product [Owenia fusiformis]|uniref:Phosphatidylinositol N-acetylglucosaminyltransferase subunit H conserved domain-containing protein n=1 Tax=Owenia fusiformis TaxID=6347 RepID=A0A8J1XR38_OWEFU|nr:unnamed protein product [Owenia fusiformis]
MALTYEVLYHDKELCLEYIVKATKFSILKWILWTTAFNIIGLMCHLHHQDWRLLLVVAASLCICLLLKIYLKVVQESLLIVKSLGVQQTTTFATGRTKSTFFNDIDIKALVINEAVTMHTITSYLAILLKTNPTNTPPIKIAQNGYTQERYIDNTVVLKAEEKTNEFKVVPLYTSLWPRLPFLISVYQGSQILSLNQRHEKIS